MHALWERTRKDGTSTVAVKLRLMRMGKKKQPTYRVVAADSRSPRDGRFIEVVGVYAPRGRSRSDRDAVVEIDDVKAMRWLSQGAKPTDRVERLLQQSGTWERFRNGLPPLAGGRPGEPLAAPGSGDPAGPGSGGAGDLGEPGTAEAATARVVGEPGDAMSAVADVGPDAAAHDVALTEAGEVVGGAEGAQALASGAGAAASDAEP